MNQVLSFKEFVRDLIARGRQYKSADATYGNKMINSKSLSRKRVTAKKSALGDEGHN